MNDDTAEWGRLKSEFTRLADLSPDERERAIARLEQSDATLARRLADLLAADEAVERQLARFEVLSEDATTSGDGSESVDVLGLTGRTIAHFRVLDVLGAGGMGVAYRAEDVRLGRTVALKFLHPQLALDAAAKRRFMHEARTASALDHPNICTLLEIGESEHGLFLAMPAYSGETLRDRLAREGCVPSAEAIAITRQLLDGLAAAHAAGITHRDLKPGNIVITTDGTVKILDFGLASGADAADAAGAGTVAYMSPERLMGAGGDERSDLWSVGVILHEMLTGERPFGAGRDLVTVHAILHDRPPPPSSIMPDIPKSVDDVVARLLARQPEDRHGSARDAAAALDAAGRQGAPVPTGHTRRTQRTAVVIVLAVLVAAVPLIRNALDAGGSALVEETSVAVLPFADRSPGRGQAHLGEGVAEEILNALTTVPGLRVPARGSAFGLPGDVPAVEAGRRLGVATVLDGSVERDGQNVRIDARLLDVRTGRTLWSHTFDDRFRDLLSIQTRIASAVAEALLGRTGAEAQRAAAVPNIVAYELYLRGVFHWNRRTTQDLRQAIEFFTQATQHDSTFARPYAGLALSYVVLSLIDPASADMLPRAHAVAARALALDSTLADAHAARGYAYHWQWQWEDAEHELRRAIGLNPSYATAHQWLGEHLAKMGRGPEAEAEMKRAIALDPLSLVAQNDLGIVYYLDRRFDEAVAQLERVRRADPAFPLPLLLLHRVQLNAGRFEQAAEQGRRWAELTEMADPAELVLLSLAARDTSKRAAARAVLARRGRARSPQWPEIAMYYALIEDRDGAVWALQRALDARAPMLAHLGTVSWLDPLREDPEVRRIVGALNFPTR